ncbi:fatty acid desaturase [Aestuariispira insulae]|uniref:Stearoyl-CoA desaturase (Delta-9 desaturase) n=1 Tax=Aestuariispira insulae TaxID=1461337 RepID=A0A3D9HF89_9PROT|nr:fatty acid desaturase [Aestuariispira insulae]RED48140.1 stearoyl-CoA desaturase (delta-9 desaturase) [Aestuariispira insulae]
MPDNHTAIADNRSLMSRIAAPVPFALVHLLCFAAIWTGVSLTDIALAFFLYGLRMFGITAGYHRYFSHRTFKTSRVFGFILAFIAQSSAQRGVIWWASNHRQHHRASDTEEDVHSPVRKGFWYAHMGWIWSGHHEKTDYDAAPDLAKLPELMWLDKHPYTPAVIMGVLVTLLFGWSGLIVGFFWSTVALWHATFCINSLAHVYGRQRYLTGDQSRNNWWLAILTMGEGWHNNHHHFQSAARQGFRWYEVDMTYYILQGCRRLGLVWDLAQPPKQVVENERKVARSVVEKAARQLAASFQVDAITADLKASLAEHYAKLEPSFDKLQTNVAATLAGWHQHLEGDMEKVREDIRELVAKLPAQAMPTGADLMARAQKMFARTPALGDVTERAREILLEAIYAELARQAVPVRVKP